MDILNAYKYIIVVIASWFVAQLLKCAFHSIKTRQFNLKEALFTSGGMPSSHTAVIVSITTLIGLTQGLKSPMFGLAFAVMLIIFYDAVKVRKSVGDQAVLIGKLLKEQGSKLKAPRVVRGHTIAEAFAGASVGIIIALVVFITT
ncbi:divergent PAP2 family protein [Candidatus Saccharibacteria bacterium]|nr:divergent PAP2 family protein [Candidatus Saccharibacteria bacterium]